MRLPFGGLGQHKLLIHSSFQQQRHMQPDNFVHMKKFTDLDTMNHHHDGDCIGTSHHDEDSKSLREDEEIDSITSKSMVQLLEETANNHLYTNYNKEFKFK